MVYGAFPTMRQPKARRSSVPSALAAAAAAERTREPPWSTWARSRPARSSSMGVESGTITTG